MIFCRPRRIVTHQRPDFAARELSGVPKRAKYRYGEPEWSPGEKPKIEFTTFIQPLTLSRRFLTPRKVTPEVFQWLVSRAPDMVVSLGLHLAPGGAVAPQDSAEEAIVKEG